MDLDANWVSPFWQALTLPPHFDLCGCKVTPLSVWHVYALENLQNPLLCGGTVEAGDVLQMMLVVSNTKAKFLELFHNTKKRTRALSKLRRRMHLSVWHGDHDLIASAIDYTESCMRVARRIKKTDSKPIAVPHALHVLRGAVKCGIAFDAAWNMPYAQARCLFDANAESSGDETLMDDLFTQVDEAMTREKEAANG